MPIWPKLTPPRLTLTDVLERLRERLREQRARVDGGADARGVKRPYMTARLTAFHSAN